MEDMRYFLDLYLNELGKKKYIPLNGEEQSNLIRKFREDGDMGAREKLINSMQRFICSRAMRFKENGLRYLDLIQEGNIGLLLSIDAYCFRVLFSSYAGEWIKGQMLTAKGKEAKRGFTPRRGKSYEIEPLDESILNAEKDFDEHIFKRELCSLVKEEINKNIRKEQDREMIRLLIEDNLRFDQHDKRSLTRKQIGKRIGKSKTTFDRRYAKCKEILRKRSLLKELYGSLD